MAVDPVLDRLLAAVIADPADDGPRLAYADRLEETGADDDRAEFIRVQLELARPGAGVGREGLRRREARLWDGGHGAWALAPGPWAVCGREPAPPCVARLEAPRPWGALAAYFGRGFCCRVRLAAAAWEAWGDALCRAAPLESVRLSGRTPRPVDGERRRYFWREGDLPPAVYRLMACADAQPCEAPGWKRYPSRAAAESAASDALLAWARSAAAAGATA